MRHIYLLTLAITLLLTACGPQANDSDTSALVTEAPLTPAFEAPETMPALPVETAAFCSFEEVYYDVFSEQYADHHAATLYADLTHDGVNEFIVIDGGEDQFSYEEALEFSVYSIEDGLPVLIHQLFPAAEGASYGLYLYTKDDRAYLVHQYTDETLVTYALDQQGNPLEYDGTQQDNHNRLIDSQLLVEVKADGSKAVTDSRVYGG